MTTSPLQHFLTTPEEKVSFLELYHNWRELTVSARCHFSKPPWLANIPAWALAHRVRAALGNELKAVASPQAKAGQPCPWYPPCALDVFFRTQAMVTCGRELGKPYVPAIKYNNKNEEVVVSFSLFGIACDYAPVISTALVGALRKGLRYNAWQSGEIRINDLKILQAEPPPLDEAYMRASLDFVTPVSQKLNNSLIHDPHTLLTGLGERLSGLARWHGLEIAVAPDEFKAACYSLGADSTGMRHRSAPKLSIRQGRLMTLSGFSGRLEYLGPALRELAPLLALGQRCHMGKSTTQGLGRYRLSWSE